MIDDKITKFISSARSQHSEQAVSKLATQNHEKIEEKIRRLKLLDDKELTQSSNYFTDSDCESEVMR